MLAHAMYGLGATLLYTPGISVTSHWFKKRRSSAMGLVICGAGIGGVLYPIMFRELFARLSELFAGITVHSAPLTWQASAIPASSLPRSTQYS
jgi:MFS family permease